jgi:hypothetical protein
MATYRSLIYVQYKDGSKPKGTKVVLGFSMGMSKPAYTDREGRAIVEHASKGKATIYVKGSKKGTLNTPGETVVFI